LIVLLIDIETCDLVYKELAKLSINKIVIKVFIKIKEY
jgi:hypothetical protein